ncbi:MAG: carboxylesterase family protein, partial [bacterium]|nr:carboxylesterase family protein [bacterium]
FLGLRYGGPPIGAHRFLAPVSAPPWEGTFNATIHPNRAMQPTAIGTLGQKVPGKLDEDCLFLNIATPAVEGDPRPVMVWIHGGGFGAGAANEYDGRVLSRQGDVVVVTINYRLGPFGFLDLSALGDECAGSGSNGFRDMVLALQWVNENIADYGGDAGNVTIFGESAGGAAVLALLGTPSADGLFHKAIANSPGGPKMPPGDRTSQ